LKISRKQSGFTLIEIMAVMVIMGVLAAVVVQKFEALSSRATAQAILWGTKELSARELLTWSNFKLGNGWPGDVTVFNAVDKNLGSDYSWTGAGPTPDGGNLKFKSTVEHLTREHSTETTAGKWKWL